MPRQGSITGRKLAMCPHRRTAWWSPSGIGSENSPRIRSAGQPHKSISCHQHLPRISSWRGKQASNLHTGLKHHTVAKELNCDAHDRYWSHVAQCTSCSAALKAMKALEVVLQVASVAVVGFLAVAKGTLVTSTVQRAAVVSAAVLCFAASRWLADFIQKNFYFQDYIHAYK